MSKTEFTAETFSGMGRPVLEEYEKNFLCGMCSIGFDDIQEFLVHLKDDEHAFHKKRNLARLVPGLGFCGACCSLMQSELNWKAHIIGLKHKNCVATLESAEALGVPKQCTQYQQPMGCKTPGVLGGVIASTDISFRMANNYNFGRGGIIVKGTPLVGLGYIVLSNSVSRQDMYHCTLCDEKFLFRHRAKHMTGPTHKAKFLEKDYPERYAKVMSVKYRALKLLYHCSMVEEEEKGKESALAKALRLKFLAIPVRGPRNDAPVRQSIEACRSLRGSVGREGDGWGYIVTNHSGPLVSVNPPSRGLRIGPPTCGGSISSLVEIDRSTHLRAGSSRAVVGCDNFFVNSSRTEFHEPQYIEEYSGSYQDPYAQEDGSYSGPYAYVQEQAPYASEHAEYSGPYAPQPAYTQDPYTAPYNVPYPPEDPYTAYPPTKRPPPPRHLPDSKRPSHVEPEGHYKNPEVSKAMAAISILEAFAQSQATADVKKKIAEIRASVSNSDMM